MQTLTSNRIQLRLATAIGNLCGLTVMLSQSRGANKRNLQQQIAEIFEDMEALITELEGTDNASNSTAGNGPLGPGNGGGDPENH